MRTPVLVLGLLAAAIAALAPSAAAAQALGQISTVEGNPDSRAMDARDRRMAARICWERGAARGADWMAENNPAYRAEVLPRYSLDVTEGGWRWISAESGLSGDLRAAARGYTDRLLEIHAADSEDGWARLEVDGPLRDGTALFAWTLPPERLCLVDELELTASARVETGDPGEARIAFVMPLSQELLVEDGPNVKACSPRAHTTIDAGSGLLSDEGACRRSLFHLQEGASWAIWVSLPESFYVVYPYTPVSR